MKIAVLGSGAIGGLFLGYLKEKGHDTQGVVRTYQVEPMIKEGLIIEGVRGKKVIKDIKLATTLKEAPELAIFATKTADLEEVIHDNKELLKDSYVLSTQNGVFADYILEHYFPKDKIITGIVMFGATFYTPNRIVHNFEGDLIIGNIFDKEVEALNTISALLKDAFSVQINKNIKGAKYLKLFINLNNCIPACLGVSMQEAFSDTRICEVAVNLIKEAFSVVHGCGIHLNDLPTYPRERVVGFSKMPLDEGAVLFSKIMTSLSKEPLYGSILQSIKRNKASEIDFINGEITRLAKQSNVEAPFNAKIVNMVHRVEDNKRFFTADEFLKEVNA